MKESRQFSQQLYSTNETRKKYSPPTTIAQHHTAATQRGCDVSVILIPL